MYGRIKPNSWEQRKLDNLLINQSIDICSEPSELGRYEVIQQGDIPVVGYTNENPFEKYEDIVLFGDHTLSLYKPNSPFLIATDGVKTFYSKGVIGLFLYYLLLKNLPKNEGYKRYSTILKDKEISLTYNQDEQKHIAGLLLGIDNLITLHQRKFFNWLLKFELNLIELFYSWEQRKYEQIFDYERPDKYIVKNDKYVEDAPTPVLTANKAFILGYTEETNTYQKPCIIFDDFTLDNKLVNFDFMVKSSAMKILTVKPDYDLNFSYSRLQSTKIEVLGHARHYISVVQNTSVYCPKIAEQKLIGELFDKLENLITLHQRKCQVLINTKKALLEKMFPSEHETMPKIRFKGFSDAWEQRKLNNYLDVSNETNSDLTFDKRDVLSVSGDFGVVNQIEFQGRSFAGESVSNYGVLRTHQVVYTKSPLKANPYGIIKTNKGKNGIVSVLYGVYQPKENVCSELIQTYFEQDARLNNYLKPLVNKGAKNTLLISDKAAINGEITFPKQYEEQTKIYRLFEILDSLITLHQRKCEKLKNMKKSLLEKMFI